MKIALIQTELIWENTAANRNNFKQKINTISSDVDLIILPEMFTTGFSMNASQLAETMQGETVRWMKTVSKNKNAALTGSIIIAENGNFYNRLLFVFPSGEIQFYDKRHLFSLADENKVFKAGVNRIIVEYKGFKICPLVCYDLRFPVFSRNTENYDVLIYVANWPDQRIVAWDILLKARAVENMCYVIGLNRFGKDKDESIYSGHSQVIDYLGDYLLKPQRNDHVFEVEISKNKLIETREKLSFLEDQDEFKLL